MRKKELEQKVSFLLEENMRLRDRRAELAQKILDDKNPDWAKINRDLKNEIARLKYENEQLKATLEHTNTNDDSEDKKSSFPSRKEADEAVNHFGFAGMYYMDVIRYPTYSITFTLS